MTANERFLRSVEHLHDRFNAVRIGREVVPLVHPFWSYSEIRGVDANLQADWEVPSHLTPFYGDWHDLFCLDNSSGIVLYLDDDRTVLWRWNSSDEFLSSLVFEPEEPIDRDESGETEIWLAPELLETLPKK